MQGISMHLDRRAFVKGAAVGAAALAGVGLSACAASGGAGQADGAAPAVEPLPAAAPNPDDQFGVDLNVNMGTIDGYLGRDDVAYRDMRLLDDPADYAAIGGSSLLDVAIEGFKVVPFPYVATLSPLPVPGAYDGERLFEVSYADDGSIVDAQPRYAQSLQIIEELFPKDKAVFLMCGGAGYAAGMKALLTHLGWDPGNLYNVGGAWFYTGDHPVIVATYDDGEGPRYFEWRADVAIIDFGHLTPLSR